MLENTHIGGRAVRPRSDALLAVMGCAGWLLGPLAAPATGQVADPGGHPFRTPRAAPHESVHRVAPVLVSGDAEDRFVALAEFGDLLGFWIHRAPSGRFELAGALHGAANSRFDLETTNNRFIEINFRVGLLLRARYGGLAARLELYHTSSHLGDEFLVDTGTEPISTSRDGLELLFQLSPLPGVIVYGGPGILLRRDLPFERLSLRGGAEWERPGEGTARPYVSLDAFGWSELGWGDPRLAGEAGVALGRHARLGLILGAGPSRAEQFFRDDETLVGISFSYRR